MHNALSDLNQHNNQASYDINTVKNQVKDQVKEALLENKKKKRGGKKQKKNQKDKYGNELSNAKALNKDTEDNRRCLNYNKSNASTITGCQTKPEQINNNNIKKEIKFDQINEAKNQK